MFKLVRRYPFFRKAVIAFFALPLMFAGGSLVSGLAQQNVGEVESFDISRGEFVARYQSLSENYRRRYGVEEVSPQLDEQIQRQVQNNLLSEYLMRASYLEKGVFAPNTAVTREIRQMSDFQNDNGEFSLELFEEFVQDPRQFAERVRLSLNQRALFAAMESIPLRRLRQNLAVFRSQQRVVEETVVTVTAVFDIGEEDIRRYYQSNRADYAIKEEADFEYVVFSLDDFAEDAVIGEEQITLAYEEFIAEQAEGRERRLASHIFVEGDGDDDFARAEELAVLATDNPNGFATLATEESADAGSAINGGSLGYAVLGDLPTAMDDALFAMEKGEVRGPLAVDGGFSILKLDDIVVPETAALSVIRPQMEKRARRDAVYDDFEIELERLEEIAHVQIGSLSPLATAINRSITVAEKIGRDKNGNRAPPFSTSDLLLESLFDDSILTQGENSEAIEINDGVYVFARRARYQPQEVRAIAEVQGEIVDILRARTQIEIFNEEKESGTLQLPTDAVWHAQTTVSLSDNDADENDSGDNIAVNTATENDARKERDAAIDRVFGVDLSRGFPAFAFVEDVGRVRVFRIVRAIERVPAEQDREIIDGLVGNAVRNLAGSGYLSDLSQRYDVRFEIPDDIFSQGL